MYDPIDPLWVDDAPVSTFDLGDPAEVGHRCADCGVELGSLAHLIDHLERAH